MFNYKLYFKYTLFNMYHVYIRHKLQGAKNISVVIPQNWLYYLALHLRLGSVYYSTQLVDMFAYELPVGVSSSAARGTRETVVVYNFHNLTLQERFFLFTVRLPSNMGGLSSITELYPNASWLEREVAELHGIQISGKKDLRNLMLVYGDSSAPFRKSFPAVGVSEVVYDGTSDLIIQVPVTVQM